MAAAAAASHRLRPLLRALQLQTLRGPLWARSPPLGLGPVGRSLATASSQAPAAAQQLPVAPQPPTVAPQAPPVAPPGPTDGGQDPPVGGQHPLDVAPEAGSVEVRLEELGLGGFGPVGLIQSMLQFLHLQLGLPWWAAIATGTLGVRVALLPLLVKGQKEAARLANHMPQLQQLSQRLAEARRGNDQYQVARAYSEMAAYQKRHNVNPLRGFLVPLVQTPVFISFFLALQRMAATPLPGLCQGGVAWFPDLTCPDPCYVLPLLVTASTWAVLELGAETGVASPNSGTVRMLLRVLPLCFLPFILHFPTAIFTYWLTSNTFSLLQTALLRLPALRRRLGFSPAPSPAPGPTPSSSSPSWAGLSQRGGAWAKLKQEWKEAKATQRGEERAWRLRNHLQMAAKGPLRQTFAHNPLEPPPTPRPSPPKRPWKETLG